MNDTKNSATAALVEHAEHAIGIDQAPANAVPFDPFGAWQKDEDPAALRFDR